MEAALLKRYRDIALSLFLSLSHSTDFFGKTYYT